MDKENDRLNMKTIKYVAIDPQGNIKGPMGDDPEFVKHAMLIGYKRAMGIHESYSIPWERIAEMGYTVGKVEIKLLSA